MNGAADSPQVTVTVHCLIDYGLWERACEMTGLNEWAVNEGRMDAEDTVTLTLEQAAEIGLLDASRRQADTRPVIVRAEQTCFGWVAQWDAWDDNGRYELDPYDPSAYWTFVHTEFCEQRKVERGECSPLEAPALNQSRT